MKTTEAYTYFGVSEYHGERHLYDGNDSPRDTGTPESVIRYLQDLAETIPAEAESLRWEGHNGFWYSGGEARQALAAEIEALRDGSHFSLNLED